MGLSAGDGDARIGRIATNLEDREAVRENLAAVGYQTKWLSPRRQGSRGGDLIVAGLTQRRLVDLGLFRNKHIPDAYLYGSVEQRRALLAGLMDSDGTITPKANAPLRTQITV